MQTIGQIADTLHNTLFSSIPSQRIIVVIDVKHSLNCSKFYIVSKILHVPIRIHCVEVVVTHFEQNQLFCVWSTPVYYCIGADVASHFPDLI